MSITSQPLVIRGLTKRYNADYGVFNINLSIDEGEVFGFLGPNGAGKSTTINNILDILRPDAGTIEVLGMDHHAHARAVHRRIGYLSGDMETDPTLTGKQYIDYAAHLYGDVDPARITELMERLKANVTTKIKHLSRGNKQKIGLIVALMHDPELLILDEPTSGLDPLVQAEFNQIIREHKAKGKTAFISSHYLSEVQTVCDRVGFIRDGKLVHVSTLESLLKNAPRRVTAHFVKDTPLQAIEACRGVQHLQHNGNVATFLFSGDINQLIKVFSDHSLLGLEIAETNLEELFMGYYQGKEEAQYA